MDSGVFNGDGHLGGQQPQKTDALRGKNAGREVVLQIEHGGGLSLVDQRRAEDGPDAMRLNVWILDKFAGFRCVFECNRLLCTGYIVDDALRQRVGFLDALDCSSVGLWVVHGSLCDDRPLAVFLQDQAALLSPGVLDDVGHEFGKQAIQRELAGNILGRLQDRAKIQSALHGKSAGLIATLGICTGLVVHTSAVAFGVAAIFQTSVSAFNILKILGVLYLLYLAWHLFQSGEIRQSQNRKASITGVKLYTRGFLMNVTNPKVVIFFLAFLPQFVDPARGSLIIQTLIPGALFIVVTFSVFGLIALSASYLGKRLKSSKRAQDVLNRIVGTTFVGLAIKLATTER